MGFDSTPNLGLSIVQNPVTNGAERLNQNFLDIDGAIGGINSAMSVSTDTASAPAAAVTVGVVSAVVAAANPNRLRISVRNNSANTIYLELGASATVATSYPVLAGEEWTETFYTGPVSAISAVAGCDVRVQEV
jgi:hypothetical protein